MQHEAVAVAKAKATRVARGTKGPVARLAVVGTVDADAIKSAINTPTTSPPAPAAAGGSHAGSRARTGFTGSHAGEAGYAPV